jgi:hypothetical protein
MKPRFLGGTEAGPVQGHDRREALANWLVSRENPYFAPPHGEHRLGALFRKGIVEP